MSRFLQYHLAKACTLLWANLDKIRYGKLKYKVQLRSGGVRSLHGVAELVTLPRCVLIILFIGVFRNLLPL